MSSEGTNAYEAQLQQFETNLDLFTQELIVEEVVPTQETSNFGQDELMNAIQPTASTAKRPRSIFEIGDGEESWNVGSNIPPPQQQQFHQQDGPSATALHNHALMGGELENMLQTPFPAPEQPFENMFQTPFSAPETLFDIPQIHPALHPLIYQFNDVGANYHGDGGGSFNVTQPAAVQGNVANFGISDNYYQTISNLQAQFLGDTYYPQVQRDPIIYPQMSLRAEVSAPPPEIRVPSAERPPIPIIRHLFPEFCNGQGETIPSQGPSSFYHGESSSSNQIQTYTPQLVSIPPIQNPRKIGDNSTQKSIRVLGNPPIQTPQERRSNSSQWNARVFSNPPIQAPQETRNNSLQMNTRVLSNRSIQTPRENNSSKRNLEVHPIQTLLERRNKSSQTVLNIPPIQIPHEMGDNSQRNVRLLGSPSIQRQQEIRNNSPQRNFRMRMTSTENQQSGEIQVNSESNPPAAQGFEIPFSPSAEHSLYDPRYLEMGLPIDPHIRRHMWLSSRKK